MCDSLHDCLKDALPTLLTSADEPLWVATPYISKPAVDRCVACLQLSDLSATRWLVRWDREVVLRGVADAEALSWLLQEGAEVRRCRNLHAKLYLRPESGRVVYGSANLTESGLREYFEIVRGSADREEAARAKSLFEKWWDAARRTDLEDIRHLQACFLDAQQSALTSREWSFMASLGAFVSFSYHHEGFQWERTIPWGTFGLERPKMRDGKVAPGTIELVPEEITDWRNEAVKDCRQWAKDQGIRQRKKLMLTADRFHDLHRFVEDRNRQLHGKISAITPERWREWKEKMREDLTAWLLGARGDRAKDKTWVDERVTELVEAMPQSWPDHGRVAVRYHLELPHPRAFLEPSPELSAIRTKATARLDQRTLDLIEE